MLGLMNDVRHAVLIDITSSSSRSSSESRHDRL